LLTSRFSKAAEEVTQLWAKIDLVKVEDLIRPKPCAICYEWTHRSHFEVFPTVALSFTPERLQKTIEIFSFID